MKSSQVQSPPQNRFLRHMSRFLLSSRTIEKGGDLSSHSRSRNHSRCFARWRNHNRRHQESKG